jgi:hypothetical protein
MRNHNTKFHGSCFQKSESIWDAQNKEADIRCNALCIYLVKLVVKLLIIMERKLLNEQMGLLPRHFMLSLNPKPFSVVMNNSNLFCREMSCNEESAFHSNFFFSPWKRFGHIILWTHLQTTFIPLPPKSLTTLHLCANTLTPPSIICLSLLWQYLSHLMSTKMILTFSPTTLLILKVKFDQVEHTTTNNAGQ